MKFGLSETQVRSRGLGESYTYKVAQNAKIMKMLATDLYSDKVLAPVRELSTNAWDGHIKGGNPGPFDIYLPTSDCLEFTIRDYGCGMDREQLTRMYTVYGESDKNHSNDFNGCMGIGSKSPFAYAESFTTTSYKDGLKYVCINAKDNNDIPTLSFIVDGQETDEPNGIEITFATKKEDTYKFEEAAQRVFPFLPVKPNMVRGKYSPQEREVVLYSGDKWRIYSDYDNRSTAVMGFVSYPIDIKPFSKFDQSQSWRYGSKEDNIEAQLLKLGVELDFDIGEIEMNISREHLQYTKAVVENIKAKLKSIWEYLENEVLTAIGKCNSVWDARVKYQDLVKEKVNNLSLLSLLRKKVLFDGVNVAEEVINLAFLHSVSITTFTRNSNKNPNRRHASNILVPTSSKIAKGNIVFYEDDVKRGAYSTCSTLMKNHPSINIIYLVKFDDVQARQDFLESLGCKDDSILKKVSDIYVPPQKKSKGIKKENVFELNLNHQTYRYHQQYWTPTFIDFKAGGIFVEINSYRCRRENDISDLIPVCIIESLRNLESLGFTIPPIIGVKTSIVKKYRKSKNWEDLFDWITRQIDGFVKTNNMALALANAKELRVFNYDHKALNTRQILLTNSKVDLSNTKLLSFYEKVSEVEEEVSKTNQKCLIVQDLLNLANYKLPDVKPKYELLKEYSNEILSMYPMLKTIDVFDMRSKEIPPIIGDYIRFIDSVQVQGV